MGWMMSIAAASQTTNTEIVANREPSEISIPHTGSICCSLGWSWSRCVGVEILPELHHIANAVYASASSDTSPCMFYLGDMYTLMSEVSIQQGNNI